MVVASSAQRILCHSTVYGYLASEVYAIRRASNRMGFRDAASHGDRTRLRRIRHSDTDAPCSSQHAQDAEMGRCQCQCVWVCVLRVGVRGFDRIELRLQGGAVGLSVCLEMEVNM